MADEVLVMYAGRIVERADVDTLFHDPRHPYTKALIACAADNEADRTVPLEPIPGSAPDLRHPPQGCRFAPRCPAMQGRVPPRRPAAAPHHHNPRGRLHPVEREPAHA